MQGLVSLLLGVSLLVAGRKLFWLFVGVVGFTTGLQLAGRFWQGAEGTAIVIAIVIAVVFALLAIVLQRFAVTAAGFLAGGFVLTSLATMLGIDPGILLGVIYIAGGIIGIILVLLLFDWALITLSSLAGASLIAQALLAEQAAAGVIFFILVITGVLVQGAVLRRERRQRNRR